MMMKDRFERDALVQAAGQAGRDWAEAAGYRESPLSGEWAGESIPELSDRFGVDLWDEDLADAFEAGFYNAEERL
jgi:hypothetical protein